VARSVWIRSHERCRVIDLANQKSRAIDADVSRVEVREATVDFRTTPARLLDCVRRIDRWIQYANAVVSE